MSVSRIAALVLCVIGLPFLLPSSPSLAATLVVDGEGGGDYLSIQPAVDAASAGDSILVRAGLYQETVRVLGKDGLLIRGVSGPELVVVQGDSLTLGIWSARTPVRVEDLSLRGGSVFGAIWVQDAKAEFVNCIVKGSEGPGSCHGVGGGGRFIFFSDVLVENCVFEQNRNWESPGGLIIWRSRADVRNSTFRENQACYGGGLEIYHCEDNQPSVIEGNLFVGNEADVWGGGILSIDSSPLIKNNTFVNNAGADNACVYVLGGRPEITHNIFSGSPHGVACATLSGYPASQPIVGPNVVWGISSSEFYLCGEPDSVMREDPRFCSPETGDYSLCADSPADGYGAYGIGCGGCAPTPSRPTTWGRMKTKYRAAWPR